MGSFLIKKIQIPEMWQKQETATLSADTGHTFSSIPATATLLRVTGLIDADANNNLNASFTINGNNGAGTYGALHTEGAGGGASTWHASTSMQLVTDTTATTNNIPFEFTLPREETGTTTMVYGKCPHMDAASGITCFNSGLIMTTSSETVTSIELIFNVAVSGWAVLWYQE